MLNKEDHRHHSSSIVSRRGTHSVVIVRLTCYDIYDVLVLEEGRMLLVQSRQRLTE